MSNAINLYPLTLDQVNNRVGIKTVAPTTRLDVTGDAFVRANVTSTSNVQAAAQFKLGGSIGDDTSLISEGAGALNVVGKRYVPVRGQPFEVGAGTLRTANVYDILDTSGAVKTSTSMKIGGLFTDTDNMIINDGSALNIVGKGTAMNRAVSLRDNLIVEGPVRVKGTIELTASMSPPMYLEEGKTALLIVGKGAYPTPVRRVSVYDKLVVNRDAIVPRIQGLPYGTVGPIMKLPPPPLLLQSLDMISPASELGQGYFVFLDGNNGFSPDNSPGEDITWNFTRLIWRGVALDNIERNVQCTIEAFKFIGNTFVHRDLFPESVIRFDIATLGQNLGFSTVVSPWFRVDPNFPDLSLVTLDIRFKSDIAGKYRVGGMWMQFKAS
jgi:hypothetical protein